MESIHYPLIRFSAKHPPNAEGNNGADNTLQEIGNGLSYGCFAG